MTAQAATPLRRSLRHIGTLLITVSGITPAASVFIMGQEVIHQAGTGAMLAFAGAAFLSLTTAYVYAELASAFPLTGGEYSIIGRTIGPAGGFMALGLNIFGGALGQAVTALGLAAYLGVVIPGLPALPTALMVTVGTTLVTLLNIRLNALITGAFLVVELLALGTMTSLGVIHPHHSLAELALHPVMIAGGALTPTPLAVIGLATAGAIYAFNGYGGAVYFGEEMYEARTRLAWVVFWSLAIAVVAEFVPITAALIGAGDLKAILSADAPLPAFLLAAGGPWFDKAVSLGVAFAIVNAMIAIGLMNARQLYCSARDGAWPLAWNRAIAAVHPRFHSPWVATLIMGASALGCCFLDLNLLVMVTGTGLVVLYAGVSLAALAGRRNGTTAHAHYRMPLFPLAPVLSLAGVAGIVLADLLDPDVGRPSLIANLAVMAASAAYYRFYLRRRGGWTLRGADGRPLEELTAEGLGD
ncbi:MAG: APC family permease [Caulobacterales bacterium]